MDHRISRRAIACALLATTCLCAPAYAQVVATPAPPMIETIDANGVDISRGDLVVGGPAISIGAGQSGLGYSRWFTSTAQWESTRGSVSQNGSTYTVTIGISSEDFSLSNGVYTPVIPSGSTLTLNSGYTYTAKDGTVATFTGPSDITNESGWPIATLVKPNGETLTFTRTWANNVLVSTYCTPNGCGNVYRNASRLQSVKSNLGYLLHIQYAGDTASVAADLGNWFKRTKITLVNLGTDYCDSAAMSCTPANPAQTLSISGNTYTDTAGRSTSLTYDASSRLATMRLPGHSTDDLTVAYDANSRVQSLTKRGVTTTYSYVDDTINNVRTTTVTDALNNQTIYKFDLTYLQPISKADPLSHTVSVTYTGARQVQSIVSPENNHTDYQYDARGNLTTVTAYPKSGSGTIVTSAIYATSCSNVKTCNQPISTTDANNNVTNYTYDPNSGAVATVTLPAPTPGAVQPQTRYTYTPLQAYFEQSSGGSPAASGQSVYMLTNVSACQTLSSCTSTSDESKTTIAYGPQASGTANNLLPVSKTSGDGTGALAPTTAVTYDNVGNVLSVQGPLGAAQTLRYRYDTDREQVGVTSPNPGNGQPDRATRITYNPDGQVFTQEGGTVIDQSDAAWANFTSLRTVTTAFDSYYRPITQQLSAGATAYSLSQTSYDADGRLHCQATRMNPAVYNSLPSDACTVSTQGSYGPDQIAQASYNAASQLTQVQVGVGTSAVATERTLSYNPNGTVASLADPNNNQTSYTYDGFDRPIRTTYPDGTTEQITLYDNNNNVQTFVNRAGQSISYSYDALNRATSQGGAAPAVTYGYDLLGRARTASFASNGQGITNSYDALSRLTSSTTNVGGTSRTMSYQYNLAGLRTQVSWWDGFYVNYDRLVTGEISAVRENGATSGGGVLATYAYDALGNRTSLTAGNGTVTSWSYDPVGRLAGLTDDLAGTANDLTVTNSYSPASQIVSQSRSNDTYSWTQAGNANTSYTSNALNQYSAVSGRTYSYDSNGNLTSDGAGDSFNYDALNRLTETIYNSGSSPPIISSTWLTYDPLNRLDTFTGNNSRFIYDGNEVVAQLDSSSGNIIGRFVRADGADELLVRYPDAGTANRRWVDLDERNSVIAETDSTGNASTINRYNEYGLPQTTNSTLFQYTGQMWLGVAGLQYSKARMYSPSLGRFMQTDPVGAVDSPNLYQYALNDPVDLSDPSGLDAIVIIAPHCPQFATCLSGGDIYGLLTGPNRIPQVAAPGGADGGGDIVVIGRRKPKVQPKPQPGPPSGCYTNGAGYVCGFYAQQYLNEKKCSNRAWADNALSIALDGFSLVPGGGDLVAAGQATAGSLSLIESVARGDGVGVALSGAGGVVTGADIAKRAGSLAKVGGRAIPFVQEGVALAALAHDRSEWWKTYNDCMAGK